MRINNRISCRPHLATQTWSLVAAYLHSAMSCSTRCKNAGFVPGITVGDSAFYAPWNKKKSHPARTRLFSPAPCVPCGPIAARHGFALRRFGCGHSPGQPGPAGRGRGIGWFSVGVASAMQPWPLRVSWGTLRKAARISAFCAARGLRRQPRPLFEADFFACDVHSHPEIAFRFPVLVRWLTGGARLPEVTRNFWGG